MKFVATEAGFKEGVGGASNAKSDEAYHYVLFGVQEDGQHSWNSGIYFEYDGQGNGAVNCVKGVSMGDKTVAFKLRGRRLIEIKCKVSAREWNEFKKAIRKVFPKDVISSGTRETVSKKRKKP
jgi:hypothetical protein